MADVINAKDNDGKTALMGAAVNGHTQTVQLLLEKGADVNAVIEKDYRIGYLEKWQVGKTALIYAAANGHTKIVQLLLEKGADVNAKKYDGSTALMLAADNGHTKIVKLLIEKGADVNAKNNYGLTAYDYAKNDEIRNLIRQYGGRSGEELRQKERYFNSPQPLFNSPPWPSF